MAAPPMLALIPALPLAAVALNLLIGDRLGRRGTAWLACGAVFASFVLAALYISVGATGLPGVMSEANEMRSFYVQR